MLHPDMVSDHIKDRGYCMTYDPWEINRCPGCGGAQWNVGRSEEHTSELQSLMRISYAVFCLKKKKNNVASVQQTTTPNTARMDNSSKHQPRHRPSQRRD